MTESGTRQRLPQILQVKPKGSAPDKWISDQNRSRTIARMRGFFIFHLSCLKDKALLNSIRRVLQREANRAVHRKRYTNLSLISHQCRAVAQGSGTSGCPSLPGKQNKPKCESTHRHR